MLNKILINLKISQFWSFIFILIISIIPRFIMLFTNRISWFGTEQGMDILIAKDILIKQIFPLTTVAPEIVWHMLPRIPGWYYFLYIPFILGNGDPFWAKVMTGLIGIITIVFIFFVVKQAFNLKTAIATSILLSISPWLIEQAGQYWPPYIIILPIAVYFFATIKFLEKKQNYAILMFFAIGLMVQFEVITAFVILLQTLLIMLLAIKYKYVNFRILIYSIFALFIVFIPNVLYDLTHKFYSLGELSVLTNELVTSRLSNVTDLLGQRIDVFVWNFRSIFTPNMLKSIILFLLMCLGTYLFIKDKKITYSKKLFMLYLASIPFIKFIILLFYPGTVQAWYLLDLAVVYYFILGIVLGYFLEKRILNILGFAVLVGLMVISLVRMNEIFKNEFNLSFGVSRIAQSIPVEYIFKDIDGQQFNYIPLTQGQHRYDFDYLFWWYGAKKYGYQPSMNKQKIRYYILDKNSVNKEFLPKKLTGKIVDTKNLQNGYSVIKVVD